MKGGRSHSNLSASLSQEAKVAAFECVCVTWCDSVRYVILCIHVYDCA